MQLLKRLFKAKEDYLGEAARIMSDKAEIKRRCEGYVVHDASDTLHKAGWTKKQLDILHDESFIPIARLTISENFQDMIADYVDKLQSAEKGDRDAIKEVVDIKSKIQNVIDDEIIRLEIDLSTMGPEVERLQEHVATEGAKWHELKEEALVDIEVVKQKLDLIIPKDREDMDQWKTYYTQRVSLLENPALHVAARLKATNRSDKNQMIDEYLSLLSQVIAGKDVERGLHVLESKMESDVRMEAKRIRAQRPDFF